MKKDYKFIRNKIKIAQIQAVGSSVLGLIALFGGVYVVNSFETQSERIIGFIVAMVLFLLSIFALYTNISAIKKYKSFLD